MTLTDSMLFKPTLPWAAQLLVSRSVAQARRRQERPCWALVPSPSALTRPTISNDAAKRYVDKRS